MGRRDHRIEEIAKMLGAAPRQLTLYEIERAHVERVLCEANGSITLAAEVLGLARRTLQRKLRSYARRGDRFAIATRKKHSHSHSLASVDVAIQTIVREGSRAPDALRRALERRVFDENSRRPVRRTSLIAWKPERAAGILSRARRRRHKNAG